MGAGAQSVPKMSTIVPSLGTWAGEVDREPPGKISDGSQYFPVNDRDSIRNICRLLLWLGKVAYSSHRPNSRITLMWPGCLDILEANKTDDQPEINRDY